MLVDLVSVFAGQRLVFHLFDTGNAFAFAIDASQQRSHQGSVGIDAFVAEFRIDDTAQIELGDFAFNRRRHVFLQHRVLACSREHGTQFGSIHAQYRSEESSYRRSSGSTYRLAIDLMAVVSGLFGAGCGSEGLCFLGVADDGVALHALRENRAVRVHDFAAPCLQSHGNRAALRRGLRHGFAIDQLDVGQLNKASRAHQRQNDADGHGFRKQFLVETCVSAVKRIH